MIEIWPEYVAQSRSYLLDKLVGLDILRHPTLRKCPLPIVFLSLKGTPPFPRYMAIGFCNLLLMASQLK